MVVNPFSNKRLTILSLLVCATITLFAQQSHLSRKISIHLSQVELSVALEQIGRVGQFRFSYDASFLDGNRRVTVQATNQPVEKILREILGKGVRIKEVGSHVILIKGVTEEEKRNKEADFVVSGVIYNAINRNRLDRVTVYEVEKKNSALTAMNGFYQVVIPGGKPSRGLCFSKVGYIDTVIFVRQVEKQNLNVFLHPIDSVHRLTPKSAELRINAMDSSTFVKWIVPQETMINSINLVDRGSRAFQTSIIPYIGSNWKMTGSITNSVSLNLLAGYTGGLSGVEVGGLLNIVRNEVHGVQIGGLGNIVGGKANGTQVGGLLNYNMGSFRGVNIGGLLNYIADTIKGVQIGGLSNVVTGRVKGVQIGGLANIATKSSDGWQIAGLANVTLRDVNQVQIAGLLNYGNDVDGVQLAGFLNITKRRNSGVQISALLNYATTLNGLQLGLINVANNVERGVPIGLFSYVQKGYHLFELSGNEIFYGNVAFKSGTRAFYNFVQFGMGSDVKMQISYGIGSIFSLSKKLSINVDASAGFVYHPTDTVYHGLLLKFAPALEYRFMKHFALFAGPAYNCFVFSKGEPSATSRGLSFYDFYFTSTQNASIQMWIGGVVGVRF